MPDWIIILAVTVGYLLASLLVGLASGGEASKTTEGYVAGDRSLGFVILYFIMGASIFSAFAFLGGPGWAYSRGAAAFYILAYGTVGLVPWYFFGPRIARARAPAGLRDPGRAVRRPLPERRAVGPAGRRLAGRVHPIPHAADDGRGLRLQRGDGGPMPVWAGRSSPTAWC